MNDKDEDIEKWVPLEKVTRRLLKKVKHEIQYSQFFFEFFTTTTNFLYLRGEIEGLMVSKQDEVFFPKKEKDNLVKIIKKDLPGGGSKVLLEADGEYYFFIGEDGGKDIYSDLTMYFINNFTLKKFLEFEKRYALLYFFTEFENYLFKCFKYILTRRPDIIDKVKIKLSIKEIKRANGDLEQIRAKCIEKIMFDKLHSHYKTIFSYAEKKLEIKTLIPSDTLDRLYFFKQVRNLYTHGNGTINHQFLKKISPEIKKDKKYNKGEKFQLTNEFIRDVQRVIKALLREFDKGMINKYPELIHK